LKHTKKSGNGAKAENDKLYRRGIDYPAYKGCKMHLVMDEKELLKWFTHEELREAGYPKPDAYHGSL